MPCPLCEDERRNGAASCRQCGEPLTAPVPDTPAPAAATEAARVKAAKRGPRRWLWVIAAAAVLLLCVLGGVYAWWSRSPPLEALLPADTAAVVSVDTPWWWRTSASLRAQPQVREAIARAEKEAGLSFEDDVAPWVGQVGVAVLKADESHPQIVVCARVRDYAAFARCLARLRSRAESRGKGGAWTDSSHDGVSLQGTTAHSGGGPGLTIKGGFVRGWIIVGIGDGAEEKALDAWSGRTPSLASSAVWKKVLALLPPAPVFWMGGDTHALSSSPAQARAWNDQPYAQNVAVSALSDKGDGLEMDVVNCPKTDAGRAFWRKIKGGAQPVTGEALARLPDSTAVAMLVNDPGGWWERTRARAEEAMDADQRAQFNQALAQAGPLQEILRHFSGQCAAGAQWQTGHGFGLVTTAEADGPAAPEKAASDLTAWVQKQGDPIRQDGSLRRLAKAEDYTPARGYSFCPCWQPQDRWLTGGSDPDWLRAPSGHPALQFPTEAHQADFVVLGSFRALPALLDEQGARFGAGPDTLAAVRRLGLEDAQWTAWLAMAPDGDWQRVSVSLRHWKWRPALDEEMRHLGQKDQEQVRTD